ncbi:MAG: AMP-binding protein [Kangiellaceae bacterium]|nr:AMP-binding protein [Kangiellaceae bacterium]
MKYTLPLAQFSQLVRSTPDTNYLHQPINNKLKTWTWLKVDQQARSIANSLIKMDLADGARVGILSKNCAEWFIADLAIMMAGMVSVPIYPTANRDTIAYIVSNSDCQVVFIGRLDGTEEAEHGLGQQVKRVIFPYPSKLNNKTEDKPIQWQDLLETEALSDLPEPQPDDTMSIVYTSGSTGNPKGVVLSFNNFASAAKEAVDSSDFTSEDRVLSYLPLAHITERGLIQTTSYYSGCKIYFVDSLETFVHDLKMASPSFFISVPRLWNKFQSGVLSKMPDKKLQFLLNIPIINKIIAKKIRKGLGFDTARVYGSGSAPIAPAILHWFNRLNVPISEGWGMTETTGLCCSNIPFKANAIGTIGKPLNCVEMKLGDNQEIMIKGDAVFEEYYKNPVETAKNFSNGWFHTGDMGSITEHGDYKIIGRVKEQFKSAKGKYVTPAPIESLLGRYAEIEQVCVMGAGRKQPIALVVMSPQTKQKTGKTNMQLLETLEQCNSKLEKHQRLDHIIVLKDDWTIENELLTPTLKIKRAEIEQRFENYLDEEIKEKIYWEC